MSETKTKNLCTVPAADLTDSQYFIAEDGGELKRIPKAQVVLKKLENMLATDTENLAGGGEVTAQELLDVLAEQVANKLLAKSQVVNNLLATVEGNPLDATQGKALKDLIDTTNNNLSNSGIPIVKKITDLYSIKTSGFYYYDAGTTNAPQSSRGGMIIANYLSDSWISLIVVPYASSKIYTNTKYNNTWVGWAESATKDDLAAKLELISSDNLPFKANTIQPNSNVTFTFKPTLPSGYILVGACVKDTKSLDNKVVPVYCNASSSNGTNTINLRLLNISNDVVSITANMGITFYLFVKK